MGAVLDSILSSLETTAAAAVAAAGFTAPDLVRDEYGLLNFPPDPDSETTLHQGAQLVTQLGEFHEGMPRESGIDKWTQRIHLHGTVYTGKPATDANGARALMASIEKMLKLVMKALRADFTQGGLVWNTFEFSGRRWAFGDGSGGGFSLSFTIVYHTLYNDPDHQTVPPPANITSVVSGNGAVQLTFDADVDASGWLAADFLDNFGSGDVPGSSLTQDDARHVTIGAPGNPGWGDPGSHWSINQGFAGVTVPAFGTVT